MEITIPQPVAEGALQLVADLRAYLLTRPMGEVEAGVVRLRELEQVLTQAMQAETQAEEPTDG